MLIIGSKALAHHGMLVDRQINDSDYICTMAQFRAWAKSHKEIIRRCVPLSGTKYHVRDKDGWNYEFEIAWEGTAARQLLDIYEGHGEASADWCYALKMSHRYLKDSVHFLKTMRDIQFLRTVISDDAHLIIESDWFKQRECETYTYSHPKLDVSKEQFFTGDGVNYIYDHDSIHLTVAITQEWDQPENQDNYDQHPVPAYTFYMKDGSEVMTSKEKFMSAHESVRLYGVYEETCVLALERSQIPHGLGKEGGPTPRWSFEMALMKVCTSITSGWFREYAWENYDKVLAMYNDLGEDDYIQRFEQNKHLLKPFEGEMQ
ncbi:hypothetical protein [Pseudomonas phage vB_PseuGesM_254]|uniref:Uncharacterized protein n=1 Tax=Pseudomonas phage vB_PseuGesM_254 TaxID=3092638 RepID=A0AAX4G883_9CAUD|nr:hypothetical protein [Pseudomonas phage PseuGes_254]